MDKLTIEKESMRLVSSLLGKSACALYLWLCYHASLEDRNCCVSINTLAADARMGRHRVIVLLREMKRFGLIEISKSPGNINNYRVMPYDFVSRWLSLVAARLADYRKVPSRIA